MKKKLFGVLVAFLSLGILSTTAFLVCDDSIVITDYAKAATYGSDTYSNYDVFVDIKDATNYQNKTIYCYNWGSSATTWPGTKMDKISDTLYGCKLKDSKNNNVIFNNGSGTQTADLDYKANYVYELNKNTWRLFAPDVDSSSDKEQHELQRVWFMPSYNGWWTDNDNANQRVLWSDGSKLYTSAATYAGIVGSKKYFYSDIGLNATYYKILRVDSSRPYLCYNASDDLYVNTQGYVSGGVTEIWTDNSGDYTYKCGNDQPLGGSNVDICLKALEGLVSCSDSSLNGRGAYSKINTNFFSKLSSSDKNTFEKTSITDYNGDEFVSYDKVEGTKQYLVKDKIAQLTSTSNAAGALNFVNDNYIYLVVVIAIVGVSIAGFVVLKKKRQTN